MRLSQTSVQADPVHLLAIADTKVGKSTYIADAAIAGFNVIYIDSDNGVSALNWRFESQKRMDAADRVHHFKTTRPMEFLKNLLRSTLKEPLYWNMTRQKQFNPLSSNEDLGHTILVFRADLIPHNWLLAIDSWTSTAADALGIGDATQLALLLNGTDQSIYGEANSNLTYICNMLQKVPYHCAVLAHGVKYEIYEKPKNMVANDIKQKMMILRETIDVPQSSSKGHGQSMASRFNHIGWFYINNVSQTEIDFTRRPDRVGGGPPNKRDTVDKLPFVALTHGLPEQSPMPENLYEYITVVELQERLKAAKAGTKPTQSVAAQAAVADGELPASGSKFDFAKLARPT